MKTLSHEERSVLRDSVQKLMNDASSEAAVRAAMETDSGFDPVLWRQLSDLGVTGLIVEEAYGGSGVGPMELEAVMEEAGAALLCSPLLASSVLAAQFLQALGDEAANTRLLPQIATGEIIASVVMTGDAGSWTAQGVGVQAENTGEGFVLNGRGNYVLHGQNADVLLVIANTGEGMKAFEVNPAEAGVSIQSLPTLDRTLRLARIDFDKTSGVLLQSAGPVWEAAESALNMGLVALAGEQAGGSQKVLEFTVEYAKTRVQFGRQIGSFQAIKHMAADLLIETESAISAARHAAACLAENTEQAGEAVSLAAFACADAYVKTTADAVQMHGGIAFTWEHPAHLYLKRARASAQLFGGSDYHRERFLSAVEGE